MNHKEIGQLKSVLNFQIVYKHELINFTSIKLVKLAEKDFGFKILINQLYMITVNENVYESSCCNLMLMVFSHNLSLKYNIR